MRTQQPIRIALCIAVAIASFLPPIEILSAQEAPSTILARQLQPFWGAASGKSEHFSMRGTLDFPSGKDRQRVHFELDRHGKDAFRVHLRHEQYEIIIIRTDATTRVLLPRHRVIYSAAGQPDVTDHLAPRGILERVISKDSLAAPYVSWISDVEPAWITGLLVNLLKLDLHENKSNWRSRSGIIVAFADGSESVSLRSNDIALNVELVPAGDSNWDPIKPTALADMSQPDWITHELSRTELERQFVRGLRRASEILAPGPGLTSPAPVERSVDHGQLHWHDGQRIVLLTGTPEQIGRAHAELLPTETQRIMDSVLCTFGTVHMIRTGRWFPSDLEEAYQRLRPHIPEDHRKELHAMADRLGHDRHVMEILNVFPELFHCSGFAVFGSATAGGKLYHGRVLDYMTTIGLQDSATTFVVNIPGKIRFVNVGYAGFIGSVSGMNDQAISLGEMGGRGEGKWDGVPMATLMRRALEECRTLDEVMQLWEHSPRTCEYYYVFADGKSNRAVGVAATPESIEFVQPGQDHELLGEGIADVVLMSSGDRLKMLRERVQEQHGRLDEASAIGLMCRPVAMKSNLHNVLFIPADRVLFVAQATHRLPAAETSYVRIDMREWLDHAHEADVDPDLPFDVASSYLAQDSLAMGTETSEDAQQCLGKLCWPPQAFSVTCESARYSGPDLHVRFPSPVYTGDGVNDRVCLDWYVALGSDGRPLTAPAVVVIHESGRNMRVGKLIARGFQGQGLHAFLLQLPTYGLRRSDVKPDLAHISVYMRQAVADARRARDAVVALPWVDAKHVALQGTSLGGFVAATSAGLDGKYDSVFLLLAGGDLFSLVENGGKDTRKLREQIRRSGISMELVRGLFADVEPNRLAHRLPQDRTWLFSGQFDDVVPPANADSLAETAGLDSDHHIVLPADHYSGIVLLPSVLKQIHQEICSLAHQ